MAEKLQGYFPIVPTAYCEDGEVDLDSMRKLVRFLIESGAQGMSPNGGDSEAGELKPEERMRVLDTVLEENNGRTPVLVGTTAHSLEESVELNRHAQQAGASAVFAMPGWDAWQPLGEKSADEKKRSDEDMIAYYGAICEVLEIPVMIHGTQKMGVELLSRLHERFPNVKYVKEETTPGVRLRQYVEELGDRMTIFGPGLHFPGELDWGAQGVMPSCCVPDLHAQVFDLHQQGKTEDSRKTWNRMLPLVFWRWRSPLAKEAGKLYLKHLGIFSTTYVRPGFGELKLAEADRQEMLAVLASIGK
jgi:dihydrodipicolinate synthase/N-acetylneuraminate lyase